MSRYTPLCRGRQIPPMLSRAPWLRCRTVGRRAYAAAASGWLVKWILRLRGDQPGKPSSGDDAGLVVRVPRYSVMSMALSKGGGADAIHPDSCPYRGSSFDRSGDFSFARLLRVEVLGRSPTRRYEPFAIQASTASERRRPISCSRTSQRRCSEYLPPANETRSRGSPFRSVPILFRSISSRIG